MIGTLMMYDYIIIFSYDKYINNYLLFSNMPPRRGLLRQNRRAEFVNEPEVPDVQNVPDIESVREQAGDNAPPTVRRRVEAKEEEIDALRALRQEIMELRAENRALREETEMLRARQPAPTLVPPVAVPELHLPKYLHLPKFHKMLMYLYQLMYHLLFMHLLQHMYPGEWIGEY